MRIAAIATGPASTTFTYYNRFFDKMAPPPTDYTQMTKREIIFSFITVTCLFFLWGLSYGLLDVLNAHFLSLFNLTKAETTLLQFAYFVSYLLVAPPMGMFMRKYGYKLGIHVGLGLFSVGAILFWPAAKFSEYGMFVGFTFIIASGLATLEVAANSYITVLGPPEYASFRLTLAQGFNGIATVVGPLIASEAFFSEKGAKDLSSVQWVYLAMCLLGCVINIAIYFAKLPEVQQTVTLDSEEVPSVKGLLKKHHTTFGFLVEFTYVGAQVAVASNALFYLAEHGIAHDKGSNMFSGMQAVFTAGRFCGVVYLRYVDPCFALFVNGVGLVLFSILTANINGKGGIATLFLLFFCESICYPVIFSVATADLGSYAKLGGGLLAAGVSGGAAWPSMQAAVADHTSSQTSFYIPMIGFVPLTVYGLVMWILRSKKYNGGRISPLISHAPIVGDNSVDGVDEMPHSSEFKDHPIHVEEKKQ